MPENKRTVKMNLLPILKANFVCLNCKQCWASPKWTIYCISITFFITITSVLENAGVK
jgi:hypothetical protein